MNTPKILLLDLESAPKVAYVWQFWKQTVHPDMVVADGYLMTAAFKWLNEDVTACISTEDEVGNDKNLVVALADVLDKADVVIAHNAKKFDVPLFNARCLIHGVAPPSPYKIIDTLDVARKKFKFDSNKLEYLAMRLGCTPKGKHKKFPGFLLWSECMKGNLEAWKEMVEYNIQDVETLEEVYLKMRPWMDQHPNVANLIGDDTHRCPKCGSIHVQRRGTYTSNVGVYQRFFCNSCHGWSRTRFMENKGNKKLLGNAGVM